jgi:hypothetical protein
MFGKVQAVDAGVVVVVVFDVCPEGSDQGANQSGEAAVVQAGPAFVKVADQQIVDGLALDVVGVHQFGGGSLAKADRFFDRGVFPEVSDTAQRGPCQ